MTSEPIDVGEVDLDTVVSLIDKSHAHLDAGTHSPSDVVGMCCQTLGLLIRFGAVTSTDLQLVMDYAREVVREVSNRRDVMDPALVDYFDQWAHEEPLTREFSERLDALLDRVEVALASGEVDASSELVDICAHGLHTHSMLVRLNHATPKILRAAHNLGIPEALEAAVSPAYAHQGQIARIDWRGYSSLALNLLAHLAADPDHGATARKCLLELGGFVQTAGEAITRLPLHLLDDDDRSKLVEIHEQRVELFNGDEPWGPVDLAVVRDSRVVTAAVWQAHDARHIL